MNRRTALIALVSAASAGPLVPLARATIVVPDSIGNTIVADAISDPLLDLITAYRDGLRAYNAATDLTLPEDIALQDSTWGPVYDQMTKNPPAARTLAGAIEAIRVVRDEEAALGCAPDFLTSMLGAALAYFDERA